MCDMTEALVSRTRLNLKTILRDLLNNDFRAESTRGYDLTVLVRMVV